MNAPPRSAWARAFEAWRQRPGEQLELSNARQTPAAGDELAEAERRVAEYYETQRETADRLGWTAEGEVE